MRTFLLTLTVLAAFSAALHAGEQLVLTRTLQLDFAVPGKITRADAQGTAPTSEDVQKNQYVLVLPPEIKLELSIANKNERRHHYHICVTIQNQHLPADKIVGVILPDKLIQNYWLASYRYQFTLVQKDAREADFVSALVKLDVYGPGPK